VWDGDDQRLTKRKKNEEDEKLSEGKVSEKKKAQLKDRASILTSFQLHMKDEL